MKTYRIYFMRHGLTEGNLKGQFIGTTDANLIPEAVDMLKAMKNKYVYPPVDEYYVSPKSRCIQTIKTVYPDCKPIIVPDLQEYNFGAFEGKTQVELASDEVFKKWIDSQSDGSICPPGGESNQEFTTRVCSAFNSVVQNMMSSGKETAVICTHGGVISTILSVYGFPQRSISEWNCLYGKGYCISITPSVWMRGGMFEVIGLFPFEKE